VEPTSSRESSPDRRGALAPQVIEGAEASSKPVGCDGFETARAARHRRRFDLWMIAVAAGYVGATAALRWRTALPAALPPLLVGAALLFAGLAALSYLRFLRAADELVRRIQTEALAIGFGAGAAYALFYPLLAKLGAPAVGENATAAVMMLAWAIGAWLGARRYSGSGGA
jgi:hypothetical protein